MLAVEYFIGEHTEVGESLILIEMKKKTRTSASNLYIIELSLVYLILHWPCRLYIFRVYVVSFPWTSLPSCQKSARIRYNLLYAGYTQNHYITHTQKAPKLNEGYENDKAIFVYDCGRVNSNFKLIIIIKNKIICRKNPSTTWQKDLSNSMKNLYLVPLWKI
jgi:hypothetical protein